MSQPKVSVVMGVYNGARFLREAVQSILDQTFKDFEFLIVNDGSTDVTARILKEFCDPRIKVIENTRNEGLTRSLIKGCGIARGEYIARMDADDISYPMRLQKQVEFLEANADYSVAGTQFHFVDSSGKRRQTSGMPYLTEEIRQVLSRTQSPVAHGSVMFVRHHILECGGYREVFRYAQDYDLWLRVMEKHKITNLKEVLYGLRFHRESTTQQKSYYQLLFGELARRFAEMRGETGSDPLMRGEVEQVRQEIESWWPDGIIQKGRIRSDSALRLAHELVRWAKLSDVLLLWLKSVGNSPLNKEAWRFLVSKELRQRLSDTIKRRL
ncbi:glycosyltransferase family 2 protein [Candidatus Poribacteria bacterium]|nr:glycosyltransferase family 2 protein [Candidatus Poribacteria bacterium]